MTAEVAGPFDTLHPRLPKVELHVHHVGSASPRIVSELAARHPGHRAERPRGAAQVLRVPRLRALHRGLPRGRGADPHPRGRALPDLRDRPRDGDRAAPAVRRAHLHPVHLGPPGRPGRSGMPIEAFTEAIETARVEAERDFGLVLRWIYDIPGEFGLPSAEATLPTPSTTARRGWSPSGSVARRSACRGPSSSPFRRGAGRRSALRAARRRDDRAGDGLGVAPPARRRADRPRHLVGPGPGAARPPRGDGRPARGVPVVQRRHPRGGRASRSTRSRRSGTPAWS